MIALATAVILTLGISAFCSLLEAILLSVTTSEVEKLRQTNTRRGANLEHFKKDIEQTSSAILALNTIANTLGAIVTGGIALRLLGEDRFIFFSITMTITILLFSEIIPKNVGVLYRESLLKYAVYSMSWVRSIMFPISWFCKRTVRFVLPQKKEIKPDSDEEIILLAQKRAQEGGLTQDERDIISNALSLDDIQVSEVMTPHTVIFSLSKNQTLAELLQKHPNLPFGRMPIYEENIDSIIGVVRRRDILESKNKEVSLQDLMQSPIFIPETTNVAHALQTFLKKHQQIAIVVDEFGSTAGVITMEDIFEHILGKEIFEADDIAIDMRELALRKKEAKNKKSRNNN